MTSETVYDIEVEIHSSIESLLNFKAIILAAAFMALGCL